MKTETRVNFLKIQPKNHVEKRYIVSGKVNDKTLIELRKLAIESKTSLCWVIGSILEGLMAKPVDKIGGDKIMVVENSKKAHIP